MEKIVYIGGMHCEHCAAAVKGALEAFGLQADVSLEEGRALVSGKPIPDALIKAAVEKKGFTVLHIDPKA